jgi:hypothetical protein
MSLIYFFKLTSAKSDSNLNAVDCGDFPATRIKVLLDIRDEDAEAETIKNILPSVANWPIFRPHN